MEDINYSLHLIFMKKIFFLSGAVPPSTGGEFYNYKLYEHLLESQLDVTHINLHKLRYLLKLSWVPLIGRLIVSFIFAVLLFQCRGLLIIDHYFSYYLFFTKLINRFYNRGENIIIFHHSDKYSSQKHQSLWYAPKRWKERLALAFADKIITVSDYTKQELISLGIAPSIITVLSPGLDRGKFKNLAQSNSQTNKNESIILCVGHCIPRKGIKYLVEAFSAINRKDFSLHIVGKTNKDVQYYKNVKRTIQQLGLSKDIVLHERVSQDELNHLYSIADIFVLPSLNEGFGIVLLEAMYYGLPIITTDISAMPELVKPSQNGLLVPPAHSPLLAQAMSFLINQPKLRQQMGANGREHLMKSYNWEDTCSEFLTLINQGLSGSGS